MNGQVFEADLGSLPKLTEELFKYFGGQSIFVFRGELGAGKTTLIKNICTFLGVKDKVSSPTFSIVNEYKAKSQKLIYHFDCYRIEDEEEALDIGIEEYLDSGELCLIEWPEKIEGLLPQNRVEIEIIPNKEKRKFIINQN